LKHREHGIFDEEIHGVFDGGVFDGEIHGVFDEEIFGKGFWK